MILRSPPLFTKHPPLPFKILTFTLLVQFMLSSQAGEGNLLRSQCRAMDTRNAAFPHAFHYRATQASHPQLYSTQLSSRLRDHAQGCTSAYFTGPVLASPTSSMASFRHDSYDPPESECAYRPRSWPLIAKSAHSRPSPVVNIGHDTMQTKSNLEASRESINSGRNPTSPPEIHRARMESYYAATQLTGPSTLTMDGQAQSYEIAYDYSPALSSASSFNLGGDRYTPLTPENDDRLHGVAFSAHQSPVATTDEYAESPGNGDITSEPYATLIYRALMSAPGHKMVLKEIYEWFERHTEKAKDPTSKGWQNSIRHNLSMNGVSLRISELS